MGWKGGDIDVVDREEVGANEEARDKENRTWMAWKEQFLELVGPQEDLEFYRGSFDHPLCAV